MVVDIFPDHKLSPAPGTQDVIATEAAGIKCNTLISLLRISSKISQPSREYIIMTSHCAPSHHKDSLNLRRRNIMRACPFL